jgi:hypothetical protein
MNDIPLGLWRLDVGQGSRFGAMRLATPRTAVSAVGAICIIWFLWNWLEPLGTTPAWNSSKLLPSEGRMLAAVTHAGYQNGYILLGISRKHMLQSSLLLLRAILSPFLFAR